MGGKAEIRSVANRKRLMADGKRICHPEARDQKSGDKGQKLAVGVLDALAVQSAVRNSQSEITIGVLALQGAVEKHLVMLKRCGVRAVTVRLAEELDCIHGLVIPGGESTTVGKLMTRYGLDKEIVERARQGMPIFGTCTGMILLAKEIIGFHQHRLSLMDISVLRNAFGRQVDSFEADLDIDVIGPPAFRAVFIRAPYVARANGKVDTLARFNDKIVLSRQGNMLACAFHPELTEDTRIHEYFIEMIRESVKEIPVPNLVKQA